MNASCMYCLENGCRQNSSMITWNNAPESESAHVSFRGSNRGLVFRLGCKIRNPKGFLFLLHLEKFEQWGGERCGMWNAPGWGCKGAPMLSISLFLFRFRYGIPDLSPAPSLAAALFRSVSSVISVSHWSNFIELSFGCHDLLTYSL